MHHGMLTVYKEAGYTSSDAVARLRGILRMRKIGHTGTLDPDAVGVLPMCLGNATRICELIADREKEYVAVMRLGVLTDTQDMSGEILKEIPEEDIPAILLKDPSVQADDSIEKSNSAADADTGTNTDAVISADTSEEEKIYRRISQAAAAFIGEIDQIPPMYSAIKVNGKRLYDMARKGITVERKPRRITIYVLEIEKVELPLVTMRVRCSKGTYIRTLCEDLGNALGTGAAMQSLIRTRVGQFTLEEARTLDELESLAKTKPEELEPLIRPVDSFFADLPAAVCSPDALRLLKNGNVLTLQQIRFLTTEEDPQKKYRTADSDNNSREVFDTSSLPGIDPGEKVVRMYDAAGSFYGLYRTRPGVKGRGLYSAYKMFLPEK